MTAVIYARYSYYIDRAIFCQDGQPSRVPADDKRQRQKLFGQGWSETGPLCSESSVRDPVEEKWRQASCLPPRSSPRPEGTILESVLEGYAAYYSADLSEKVIRGMTENALKGKFTGGAIPLVGHQRNHRFERPVKSLPLWQKLPAVQRWGAEIRDWLNESCVWRTGRCGGLMTFQHHSAYAEQ